MPGYPRLLNLGDEGIQVLWLQEQLHRLGKYFGPIDGVFGRETKQAVILLQQQYGLQVDGLVGPQTRGTIYSLFYGR
jgi:peptidoglycan hydrolase-like protein with peptidoglycan-binding domain